MKYQTLGVMAFSFTFNFIKFFQNDVNHNEEDPSIVYRGKTALGANKVFEYVHSITLYYLFILVLPVAVLVFLNINLVIALRQTKKKKNQMMAQKAKSIAGGNKDDITLALVIVVLVYLICQIPSPLRRLLIAVTEKSQQRCGG